MPIVALHTRQKVALPREVYLDFLEDAFLACPVWESVGGQRSLCSFPSIHCIAWHHGNCHNVRPEFLPIVRLTSLAIVGCREEQLLFLGHRSSPQSRALARSSYRPSHGNDDHGSSHGLIIEVVVLTSFIRRL